MSGILIKTFGCRANQAEAFAWAEEFQSKGVWLASEPGGADLVVINSCTLTARADRDVYKFIRKVRRENPGAKIVVTGCLAERTPGELKATDGVSLVIGNGEKDFLVARAWELAGFGNAEAAAGGGENVTSATGRATHSFRSRAILKIQDGCSMRCAYCIIPSVRGPSRSVPVEKVMTGLENLAGRGFREAVLAGIHLSSYGEDLRPRRSLAGLLREAVKVGGLGWIRLTSLDPRKMSEELVSFLAGNPKIAQHFHLSLQHVSENVLRRMGRGGGAGPYGDLLEKLRRASPEAALGADIIVGLPGETDQDFDLLRDFLESSPLTYFHVFSFSPREGTAAAGWARLPDRIVTERSEILRRISARKKFEFRSSLVGREIPGIVIHEIALPPGEAGNGKPAGAVPAGKKAEVLTHNYVKVIAGGQNIRPKEIVKVTITGVSLKLTEGFAEGRPA